MADFEMMTNLNLNGQELKDFRAEHVGSLPTASATMNGRIVYLTTDNRLYKCLNGVWVKIATTTEVTDAQARSKVTVEKVGDSYIVKQNGTQVGTAINVPKDMVVESGEILAGDWENSVFTPREGGKGKALMLVIANGGGKVYIDVADLVDAYTGANGTTVNVSISNDNKVSAALVNGSITEAHLNAAFVTTLKSATITAPTASSTQAAAGTKAISALFQTVVNNIKQLFVSIDKKVDKVSGKGLSTNDYTAEDKQKLDFLKQARYFQSAALVGIGGTIENTANGLVKGYPALLQAVKGGKPCGLAMWFDSQTGVVTWESNVALTADMAVKIIGVQAGTPVII